MGFKKNSVKSNLFRKALRKGYAVGIQKGHRQSYKIANKVTNRYKKSYSKGHQSSHTVGAMEGSGRVYSALKIQGARDKRMASRYSKGKSVRKSIKLPKNWKYGQKYKGKVVTGTAMRSDGSVTGFYNSVKKKPIGKSIKRRGFTHRKKRERKPARPTYHPKLENGHYTVVWDVWSKSTNPKLIGSFGGLSQAKTYASKHNGQVSMFDD